MPKTLHRPDTHSAERQVRNSRKYPVEILADSNDICQRCHIAGSGTPDQLFATIEQRFLETGEPRELTFVFSTGLGVMKGKGLNRIAHQGLLRCMIGGYFGLSPKLENLVVDDPIEA